MVIKWRVVSSVLLAFVVLLVVVLVLPGGVKSEDPSVLVVTLNSIHRVWPPQPPKLIDKNYTLNFEHGYVKTLDFDYGNRSFCYIHQKILYQDSEFLCATIDNFTKTWELPKPTLFPSQYAVGSMAYDWASGAWYFLDKQQQCIYVCDSTLQHCRMLRRDVRDPRGLAVDPTPPGKDGQAAGFIFLSQNNTSPSRLVRTNLSGGDVTALLPSDCTKSCKPVALTLDIANKWIFWVDDDTDTVQKSAYDGTGRTTLYRISEVSVKLDSLLLVSRASPSVVEVRPSPLADASPPSMLVDASSSSMLVAAPAAAARPTVADVDLRMEYLYFFDSYYRQIIRQKLDGTGREVFIKDGIGECQGLAVDWLGGNLYWTDEQVGRVFVTSLAAPAQRRELIKASFEHPSSIVLDPPRGVMYFSTWALAANPSGSIAAANMDGSERRTLVSGGLDWPSGLVLDAEKQLLYWCDTRLNKIESLELASNTRTTILSAPDAPIKEPYGLVVIGGDVMWSERGSGLLKRRAGAGGNVTLVEAMTPPLFDIRLVSGTDRQGNNSCSVDNGGCEELCLAKPGGRTCACAAGRAPRAGDPARCGPQPPDT